jgi:protein ImuA
MHADPATLSALRQHIARLERNGTVGNDAAGDRLTFGLDALDAHLPGGGLQAAAVHEVLDGDTTLPSPTSGQNAAIGGPATAFAAALAGRRQCQTGRPAVWIAPRHDAHESLYRHGLAAYGLDPETLIAVRIPGHGRSAATRALWALEECLRERVVSLVCAELDTLDLAASRRLQLAAAAGGTTGLLLRRDGAALLPTASMTRWRVASAPSADLGTPRWRVELLRARNGRPRHWLLEWRHDPDLASAGNAGTVPAAAGPGERPAGGFALAAPLRDRPDQSAQPRRLRLERRYAA